MSENTTNNKQQESVKAEIFKEVCVRLRIATEDKQYIFEIPAGAPYEEAEQVCQEFAKIVTEMKQQAQENAEKSNADEGVDPMQKPSQANQEQ